MTHVRKKPVALASVTTFALVLGTGVGAALGATVSATPIAARSTSTWTPPSSDPSGITFIPGKGLLVSDAEIEETLAAPINHNNNLFSTTLAGVKTGHGSTVGWSNEPTGVAYVDAPGSPWHGHLFVSDDDRKEVFDISGAGADGQFGTTDDGSRTSFKTSQFGNTDPEDVAFDPARNELWIAGGLSTIISRVNPGPDNKFTTAADNVVQNFSIPQIDQSQPPSPEGMAWDRERDTVYVLDGESEMVFELAHNGAELNRISLSGIDMQSPGGITLDPSSTGSARTFYIADRGLDPNGERGADCPVGSPPDCEAFNDGVIHEVRVNMPAIGNRPPTANAGVDQIIDIGETVSLNGAGVDSDATDVLSYQWTVAGPGTATLATPNAASTTASNFSAVGDYVFTLTVRDSKGGMGTDTATVRVFTPGEARNVSIPIAAGTDDAQEYRAGTDLDYVEVNSADNELGSNYIPATNTYVPVQTGFRFVGLPIPKGAEIVKAQIQFKVDEAGTGPANFTINGQAAANPATFTQGRNKDISTRPRTAASVAWSPPEWAAPGSDGGVAGPGQLTPDLKSVLQEIVNRPDWARGNAAAFFIQGSGRRTAEAKDGLTPPVLLLEFKTNAAPVVNAGPDATITLPTNLVNLNGEVTDDGLPKPPGAVTTTWTKVTGPGTVSFGNPTAVDTTATFSMAGVYTLRLTADDGMVPAASVADDIQVTVNAAPTPNTAPTVRAGSDATITLPTNVVNLNGEVTDDGLPKPPGSVTTTWSQVSGPAMVSFGNPTAVDTTATFSAAGVYELQLSATDGTLTNKDIVKVTVIAAPTGGTGGGGTGGGGTGGGGSTPPPTEPTDPPAEPTEPPSETQKVAASMSDSTVMVGRVVRFSGSVSPAGDGQLVQLQRRKAGAWVTLKTQQVTSAGARASFSFAATSQRSAAVRYRVRVPAYDGMPATATPAMTVLFYKAAVTRVSPEGEWAKIKNTGAVVIDLAGWTLRNSRTGRVVTLEPMIVRPGRAVRVHSGAGRDDGNDMYLGVRPMWNRHGKAVLSDDVSRVAYRYRY